MAWRVRSFPISVLLVALSACARTDSSAPGGNGNRAAIVNGMATGIDSRTGMHLGAPQDWTPGRVLVNVAKLFRRWGHAGTPWVANPSLVLTADGYPANQSASALTYLAEYPDGDYKVSYKGTGTLTFSGGFALASPTWTPVGDELRNVVQVRHGVEGTLFIVTATPGVADLKILIPGEDYGTTKTFTDDYVASLRPFAYLRYMDWLTTNVTDEFNTPQREWEDRPTPRSFSYATTRGMAYETIVELTNLTGKDMWINLPHLATDGYAAKLADFLVTNLDFDAIAARRREQGLKTPFRIYVEYSNEVWNAMFTQYHDVLAQAKANPALTAADDWGRMAQQAAFRQKQLGDILAAHATNAGHGEMFQQVFGSFVLNSWWTQSALEFVNQKYGDPSRIFAAVAIAPYLHMADDADVPGVSLDAIFAALTDSLEHAVTNGITENVRQADRFHLPIWSYEGGQHLLVWNAKSGENRNFNAKRLAQYDERMRVLYGNLRQRFDEITRGGNFTYFSHVGRYDNSGFWGALELAASDLVACSANVRVRNDGDDADALLGKSCPKHRAIQEWIAAHADGAGTVADPTPTPTGNVPTATTTPTASPTTPAPVTGEGKPLSDLAWQWAVGTIHRDVNATGSALRLAGRTYAKGLGLTNYNHASWRLDGGYRTLVGIVGFDDTAVAADVQRRAWMKVQIVADGRVVFERQGLRTGDGTVPVQVDVTGVRELEVIASGKNDFSVVNFADARLLGNAVVIPTPPPPAAGRMPLQALPVDWAEGTFRAVSTCSAVRSSSAA